MSLSQLKTTREISDNNRLLKVEAFLLFQNNKYNDIHEQIIGYRNIPTLDTYLKCKAFLIDRSITSKSPTNDVIDIFWSILPELNLVLTI